MVDDRRLIAVVGEGSESGTPDRCAITIALNVADETTADALTRVSFLADQVVDKLRGGGVTGSDVQTQTISVQDFFDQKQQKVTARVGTYVLMVEVGIGEVGPHLASLADVAGDSLQVRGLQLTVSNVESLRAIARRRAVEDAQARAEQLADAAHVGLGPILSIEESGSRVGWPGPQRTLAARSLGEMPPMPIEPGTVSTAVRVAVTYQIED